MKEHPFPPVVRWVLFPALAAIAGAVGGGAAAALFLKRELVGFVALTAFLGAGGALGAVLAARVWVTLLCAPVLGALAGFMSFYVAVVSATRNTGTTFNEVFNTISGSGFVLPLLISTITFQTAAHAAALRPRFRGEWLRPAAFYLAAALLIGVSGFAFGPASEAGAFTCLASSAIFQVVAFRVAADLSRRLRPPEA